jgi:UDP-glucose 4-epimerase
MANCIVTGAAGFIGSHLAEALALVGHDVLGIDALTDNYNPQVKRQNLARLRQLPNFVFRESAVETLGCADLPSDNSYVFHLAGQPGVRDSWDKRFTDCVQNNLIATRFLLERLRNKPPIRLILASSSSVYGSGINGPERRMQESDPLAPLSPYAVTKAAAEHLCLAYSREFAIPTTVLRFFSVYGSRQRPDMLVQRLLAAVRTGEPITIYGPLDQRRDFTHVADIVRACMATLSLSQPMTVLNVGSGVPVQLSDCLVEIESATGMTVPLHFERRHIGDPHQTWADISAARTLLGYAPRIQLSTGIREQWDWLSKCDSKHSVAPMAESPC